MSEEIKNIVPEMPILTEEDTKDETIEIPDIDQLGGGDGNN